MAAVRHLEFVKFEFFNGAVKGHILHQRTAQPVILAPKKVFILTSFVDPLDRDHGLRGSASPVLTATGFVNWEMAIFDLPTESTPLNQSPKNLVQVIILAAPTAVPNLVQIRPWEASGQMGEI